MKGRKRPPVEVTSGAGFARCPSPPSWLPQHAKAEWKRAAPELFGWRLLARDMLATLEAYCIAAGQVREFEATMKTEGRIIKSETGPRQHPAFRMQQAAMREARLLAAELGLTPHRRGMTGGDGDNSEGDGGADGWSPDLLA